LGAAGDLEPSRAGVHRPPLGPFINESCDQGHLQRRRTSCQKQL
jgi:hypothetical protein